MNYVIGVASPYILFGIMKVLTKASHLSGLPTTILTVLLPIAMLLMTLSFALEDGGSEIVGWLGVGFAVIPTFILLTKIIGKVEEIPDFDSVVGSYKNIALLFPATCIGCLSNFWAKGVGFSGFMIPYTLAVGYVPLFLINWIFLGGMVLSTFLTICLIIGLIALAVMITIRLVMGSPFN